MSDSERFRDVDPGDLRLPPSRPDGPSPHRYRTQVQRFGRKTDGMPVSEVTECKNGELMINNGVTRAVRVFNLSPGTTVSIEIIDRRPNANTTSLNRVRDVTPPE